MNLKNISTLVFDLDGTLVDSSRDIRTALNMVMKDAGMPQLTLAQVKSLVGHGARSLIERTLKNNKKGRTLSMGDNFLKYYEDHLLDTTKPYRGIRELIAKVKDNYKMAVATNKPYDMALETVKGSKFENIFKVVAGPETTGAHKPDPGMLHHIAKKLRVKPCEMLLIGDGVVDVQTAKNFGCPMCAVTWGFSTKKELKAEKPDFMIDRPSQLLKYLK